MPLLFPSSYAIFISRKIKYVRQATFPVTADNPAVAITFEEEEVDKVPQA
jgi:hypothetical protein